MWKQILFAAALLCSSAKIDALMIDGTACLVLVTYPRVYEYVNVCVC